MAALLLVVAAGAGCGPSCSVAVRSTPVPGVAGTGNFDGVEIDAAAHRVYAADRTTAGVDVFDTGAAAPRFVTTIHVHGLPNGLAVAADRHKLYVGTNTGAVAVIDTQAGAVVGTIDTGGPEADLLDYSADRARLYVSTGSGGQLVSVDPATDTVRAKWTLGGSLEQPRYDAADDTVYVTGAKARGVFAVNPNTGQVSGPYSLGGCRPAGMAIEPRTNRALIACGDRAISWDVARRKVIDRYPEVQGGDLVSLDAQSGHFLVAVPGRSPAVAFFSANPIAYEASVPAQGGHAAVFDPERQLALTTAQGPGRAALLSFREPGCRPLPGAVSFVLDALVFVVPALVLVAIVAGYTLRRSRSG